MSQPIQSVARVANTPAQAKIFVAMLEAEGIPARIDGDSLADEFAVSQRLLNLSGTRVLVPTSALQRAQEILQMEPVDPEELERAALVGAPPPPTQSPETTPTTTTAAASSNNGLMLPLLAMAIGAAAFFAFLWRQAVSSHESTNPEFHTFWEDNVLHEQRKSDLRVVRRWHDHDLDGLFERGEVLDADGRTIVTYDQFVDGHYLRSVASRVGDLTTTWTDDDRNGLYDSCVVTDRDGKQVQALRWQPGTGFVPLPK